MPLFLSPFPSAPFPTAGRKPRHKPDTCVVAQEVALSYAPAFWVICFYLSFLKKEKKREKRFPHHLFLLLPPKTTCQNQILPKSVTAL